MRGFRRSGRFGVIGVLVLMVACAAIALTLGSNQADPKLAMGLIFGLIAVFLVVLFTLQSRDLSAVAGADARARAGGPAPIDNPMTMDESELWAAMAVRPIDPEAARARSQTFQTTRGSIRLGMLICVLIFAGVVPIYLFGTFVPLFVCAPLIALIALWRGVRVLMPGGDVDRAYDRADLAMKPLGLSVSERPEVGIRPRYPSQPGWQTSVRGPLVLDGERHGRRVSVVSEDGASEVTVRTKTPEFRTRARDGRIRLGGEGPAAVRDALEGVPSSARWSGVELHGGADGIVVRRKRGAGDFLCDLWLAERIADGLGSSRRN